MAAIFPRRIHPADQWLFTGEGRLVGFRSGLSGDEQLLVVPQVATVTRAELTALADAGAMVSQCMYRTSDDGLMGFAQSGRFFQPLGPLYLDNRTWHAGADTSEADRANTTTLPMGPNAVLSVHHVWEYDSGTQSGKVGRILLGGTLGTTTDATEWFNRTLNSGTSGSNRDVGVLTTAANQNDSAIQIARSAGTVTSFGASDNTLLTMLVNTATSKLLRVRSKTAKTGTYVGFTATRTGTTANCTSVGHGLETGDWIGVTGASPTTYNVDPVQVIKLTADTFTYTMASDPGSSAGGTPQFQKYLTLRLRQFLVKLEQGLAIQS